MSTVIAFVSQKGGVGKSTLARALGREATKSGLEVKIADLDTQQGTAVDWYRIRLDANIEPIVPVELFRTAQQALAITDRYDLLVIDGPARTSKATVEIAAVANLVVQPTGASLDDLRPAVREFHGLVKAGIPKEKLILRSIISGPTQKPPRLGSTSRRRDTSFSPVICRSVPVTARPKMLATRSLKPGFPAFGKADALVQSLIDRVADNG